MYILDFKKTMKKCPYHLCDSAISVPKNLIGICKKCNNFYIGCTNCKHPNRFQSIYCSNCGIQLDHKDIYRNFERKFVLTPDSDSSIKNYSSINIPNERLIALISFFGSVILFFRNGKIHILNMGDGKEIKTFKLPTNSLFPPITLQRKLFINDRSRFWIIDMVTLKEKEVDLVSQKNYKRIFVYSPLIIEKSDVNKNKIKLDELKIYFISYIKKDDVSFIQEFRVKIDAENCKFPLMMDRIDIELLNTQKINNFISKPIQYDNSLFFFTLKKIYLLNLETWKIEDFSTDFPLDPKKNVYKITPFFYAYGKGKGIYRIHPKVEEKKIEITKVPQFESRDISFSISNGLLLIAQGDTTYILDPFSYEERGKHIDTNNSNHLFEPKAYGKYIFYVSRLNNKLDNLKITDLENPLITIDKENILHVLIDIGLLLLVCKEKGNQKMEIYNL